MMEKKLFKNDQLLCYLTRVIQGNMVEGKQRIKFYPVEGSFFDYDNKSEYMIEITGVELPGTIHIKNLRINQDLKSFFADKINLN